MRAKIWIFTLKWLVFTPLPEPISSEMAEVRLRRLARQAVLRPARKNHPLHFLRFPPAEIFWIWKRSDFSVGSPAINGRGGVAQGGTAARTSCKHDIGKTDKSVTIMACLFKTK